MRVHPRGKQLFVCRPEAASGDRPETPPKRGSSNQKKRESKTRKKLVEQKTPKAPETVKHPPAKQGHRTALQRHLDSGRQSSWARLLPSSLPNLARLPLPPAALLTRRAPCFIPPQGLCGFCAPCLGDFSPGSLASSHSHFGAQPTMRFLKEALPDCTPTQSGPWASLGRPSPPPVLLTQQIPSTTPLHVCFQGCHHHLELLCVTCPLPDGVLRAGPLRVTAAPSSRHAVEVQVVERRRPTPLGTPGPPRTGVGWSGTHLKAKRGPRRRVQLSRPVPTPDLPFPAH